MAATQRTHDNFSAPEETEAIDGLRSKPPLHAAFLQSGLVNDLRHLLQLLYQRLLCDFCFVHF
jgi:hypothetical protein